MPSSTPTTSSKQLSPEKPLKRPGKSLKWAIIGVIVGFAYLFFLMRDAGVNIFRPSDYRDKTYNQQ